MRWVPYGVLFLPTASSGVDDLKLWARVAKQWRRGLQGRLAIFMDSLDATFGPCRAFVQPRTDCLTRF